MIVREATSIINTGKTYQFVDDGEPMSGGMKDVFFSPDRTYVVAFYRDPQDDQSKERLRRIVTQYYDSFFNKEGGQYYKSLYSWPTDVVDFHKVTGIVVPVYNSNFYFKKGYANNELLKGKEKEGKWFASARFRSAKSRTRLDDTELGDWLSYFQVGVNIARGVKRLHAAGLAHSDLSYKNVLIDPVSKTAAIIDIDGLVVPNLFPPDVLGTADFIAPEVLATRHLDKKDPKRQLPSRYTDLHALAVLIYMYLFYRHPLRGGNYFGAIEAEKEEDLLMGEKALFIEHPSDSSNRNFEREYGDNLAAWHPWTDLQKTPYTIAGPYLKELFDQAFIHALHDPTARPTADAWEQALIKTNDLKLKCANNACAQKWFIYNNTTVTSCPFCGTQYNHTIPVLDSYYQFQPNVWKPDNLRLAIYHNSTLHHWHVNRNILRNERLADHLKERVGYFAWHNQQWIFVNEKLTSARDVTGEADVPIGSSVILAHGTKLLLSKEDGGRLVTVSIANT